MQFVIIACLGLPLVIAFSNESVHKTTSALNVHITCMRLQPIVVTVFKKKNDKFDRIILKFVINLMLIQTRLLLDLHP